MPQRRYVLLTGGPLDAPMMWPAPAGDESVKISDGAGYDHFAFTEEYVEHNGLMVGVYSWRYRTFVAE